MGLRRERSEGERVVESKDVDGSEWGVWARKWEREQERKEERVEESAPVIADADEPGWRQELRRGIAKVKAKRVIASEGVSK